MADSCTIMDNDFFSKAFKDKLDLKQSPVAIKFILREEDLPEGIPQLDGAIRHCEMVQKASQEGVSFYATAENQQCKGGAAALGVVEAPQKVKTGEMYYSLGRFKSLGSGKRTLDAIPKIDLESYALVYAPLEDADFQPDIIVIITNPKNAMILSQAIVYTQGGRVHADFAGIQSVCADAVAGPFTRKEPNITLGCSGSRKAAKIKDDEVIVGLMGENVGCIVNALSSMS